MSGRVLLAAIALATCLQVALVAAEAADAPAGAALHLIRAGADGPSAAAVAVDFDEPLPDGLGHDGQQNYAIARDPWHPASTADHLDRPRYRLQRPLLPVLAWALHPVGGGPGLVWALFAVGAAAIALLGWATAAVARRVGAPPMLGVVVVLLPLASYPLRITTSDALALACTLVAAACHLDRRPWAAGAWGTAAVLAKESSLLVLAGLWLAGPSRRSSPVVLVPAAAGGALAVALRLGIEATEPSVGEFTVPFGGLWDSFDLAWAHGDHLLAAVSVLGGLVLGVVALATAAGRRHPLAPALALQVAFTLVLDADVLGLTANGTRTTAPLTVLALLVLASPGVLRPEGDDDAAGADPDAAAATPPSAAPA